MAFPMGRPAVGAIVAARPKPNEVPSQPAANDNAPPGSMLQTAFPARGHLQ